MFASAINLSDWIAYFWAFANEVNLNNVTDSEETKNQTAKIFF